MNAFNQALTIDPEFALAYNGRGAAYFGQGEFEQAAQDFRTAARFSPILTVAEINQGFATAYASQLIALASLEQKPGTTLESFYQQQQVQLQTRQQELTQSLPGQQFWSQMRAWPNLPASEQQNLIRTHGLAVID